MKETQENIDRLAIIISDYVALYEVGQDNLTILDKLFDELHISPELSNWWTNRFTRAFATSKKESIL